MINLNKWNIQQRVFLLIILFFVIGRCNRSADNPPPARVGRVVLTMEMVHQAIGQHLSGLDSTKLKRDFINWWVEQELLYQSAIKSGFYDTERIRKELQRIQQQLVIENYLEHEVESKIMCTEQEIQEFYHKNVDDFITDETVYNIQHIVVKTSKEVQIVESQLKKGVPFEELMSENVEITMGFLSSLNEPVAEGKIPSPFREVIKKLKSGETSKQIFYEKGYHFVKLFGEIGKGKTLPLNLVRRQIVERLHVQKRKEQYNQLLKRLHDDKDAVVNYAPGNIVSSEKGEQDSATTTQDSSVNKTGD